jgi:ferredoxin-type protein NapH
MKNNKYLILRRVVQSAILLLFLSSSYWGMKILMGNYSTAYVLEQFYLTDPYAVLQMLFTGFLPSVELLIGAAIITLFYAILGGRLFCSWVCPLNIVTDFASYLRKRFKIKTLISKKDSEKYRKLRYYVLLLGLVLSMIFGQAAFELFNPISMLHRTIIFGFGFGINIVAIVFLADLFIMPHMWCGHLCPVGAMYVGVGKFSLLKIYHTKENCTNCMKCKKVCPEVQVLGIIGEESNIIKSSACTDCARCIDVCDDDALRFKIINGFKRTKN